MVHQFEKMDAIIGIKVSYLFYSHLDDIAILLHTTKLTVLCLIRFSLISHVIILDVRSCLMYII